MATTVIGAGFTIDPTKAQAHPEADEKPLTVEEELLLVIGTRLRQGLPKAAIAAAADLVNSIAAKHGLDGGAYL